MRTRFAPSPTGPLHLGHAFSALTVWKQAALHRGTVLLRIEDTDSTRCRPEHIKAIMRDLAWLGLTWPVPVLHQSRNLHAYRTALHSLASLTYPCSCTRRAIKDAGGQPGHDGLVYPGTCRNRSMDSLQPTDAIRLDLKRAISQIGPLSFNETGPLNPGLHRLDPADMIQNLGDPVLRRPENEDIAYMLAAPHDDAAQGISHVIRGIDLWHATPIQVLLQALMNWPTPTYHHHDLIRDANGRRLAKIDKSRALSTYRDTGCTPKDIRAMVGLSLD